jgi:hypothetical protein
MAMPLTCGNTAGVPSRILTPSVRDEEAAGSNPATPTKVRATIQLSSGSLLPRSTGRDCTWIAQSQRAEVGSRQGG